MKWMCFLTVSMFFVLFSSFGQEKPSNLYLQALERHIEKYYNHSSPSTLNIIAVLGITEALPDKINGVKINYLSNKDILRKSKKEGIVVTQIYPIKIDSYNILLEISEFSSTVNKGKLHLIKYGGSNFNIDKVDGKYVIVSENHGGL